MFTGLASPGHLMIVMLVVLLVFGAKRLPEMGRSLGSGLREFKSSIGGEDHQEPLSELRVAAHDREPSPELSELRVAAHDREPPPAVQHGG